jgi:hypothetical protein
MRRAALSGAFLLLAAACSEPQAGLAIEGGSQGVTVSPSVSGAIGGLTVSVRG